MLKVVLLGSYSTLFTEVEEPVSQGLHLLHQRKNEKQLNKMNSQHKKAFRFFK